MDRPRPLLLCHPKRLAHDRGNGHGADDLMGHLGQWGHGRDHVHDLEQAAAQERIALIG
jgi:hypothetical protein